jgi:hypothetical protein
MQFLYDNFKHFKSLRLAELETNNGFIFAASAAAFIIFPFLGFLIYDRKVAQQQQVIMSSAARSNAIISSLFPDTVRDKLSHLVLNNNSSREHDTTSEATTCLNDVPIAELYTDTTVLFAGKYFYKG